MNKLDLIEKYIQKKASPEELEVIKKLMEEDSEFRKEVVFHLELRQAVKKEESQKLKQHLQGLEQGKKRPIPFSMLWKVAAVFIVGLGLFWFFTMSPDHERLYMANFEPYPNIVAPTVRDINSTADTRNTAFRYYDNREYDKASAAFKELYEKDKVDYANFYYAISLMADEQIEEAIEALENPHWEVPEKYQHQTDWYLAIGHLKQGNKEQAIVYLNKVINSNGAKSEQARKILEEL